MKRDKKSYRLVMERGTAVRKSQQWSSSPFKGPTGKEDVKCWKIIGMGGPVQEAERTIQSGKKGRKKRKRVAPRTRCMRRTNLKGEERRWYSKRIEISDEANQVPAPALKPSLPPCQRGSISWGRSKARRQRGQEKSGPSRTIPGLMVGRDEEARSWRTRKKGTVEGRH